MPFTISHAVIAPPLAKLSRNTLPIAALAIGSMTPDLYRLFTMQSGMLTHQWKGLFYPNLALGYYSLPFGIYFTDLCFTVFLVSNTI